MKYKILWDTDILIDLILLHLRKKPYIEEVEKFFSEKGLPIYIASFQLPLVKLMLSQYFRNNKMLNSTNEVINKFLKTHKVKVLKTPSYVDISLWSSNEDISEDLLKLTAEAFDCYILTQKDSFLKKLGYRGINPKNIKKFFIAKEIEEKINMIDLSSEIFSIYPEIEKNLDNVIRKTNFILGDEVKQLEEVIANFVGTTYAVGVSSGTDALVLSLRAIAIVKFGKEFFDKEDLIITTPFTFTATGEAILRAGATPLFVDIDLETYNINPELVEKAVKKFGKRVKGIIPVHLYGQPCNMDEIMRIAKEYDLFIVEDCAQSLGAKWAEKQTGSFGDTGCFSFFPTKPLGGFGDGGMITTNDDRLYEIILMLRKHGGKDKYNVEYVGYNARLDTLQAAVLLAKFKYLDRFIEKKRKIVEVYNKLLKDIDGIKTPYVHPKAYHIYHQYTIRVLNKNRNEIQKKLKDKGITTKVYYPVPLHKMKVFEKNGMEVWGSLKNSEIASKSVLSLPIIDNPNEFKFCL